MLAFIIAIIVLSTPFSANAQSVCLTNPAVREAVARMSPGDTAMSLIMCQIFDQEVDLGPQGYTLHPDLEVRGSVQYREEIAPREIILSAGTEYVFSGACNRGCNFLGMTLKEKESRHTVATSRDVEKPHFNFTPTDTKPYLLYPIVEDCRMPLCPFMIMGFARSK